MIAAMTLAASSAATAAQEPPICADRPGKGTGTCTVPSGHLQIETGLIDWTHDRSAGTDVDLSLIGSSLIKYGISDRADIEIGVIPLEIVHVGGSADRSSFGDMLVRAKYALTTGTSPVSVALDPFVKLPTANRELGNRKVEAGLTLPIGAPLGGPLSLAVTPEIDWHADFDGHGHHLGLSQVVGLGIAASSRLTLSAELWGAWDWDPSGTRRQYSADGAIAYLVGNNVQLDAGANFGLNQQTPDVEIYTGVSARF